MYKLSFKFSKRYCVFDQYFSLSICISFDIAIYHDNKLLKGKLQSKKSLAQMKEREKCRKRAFTDLNAPNGSRDIPFQSQEFGQDGHRHFVCFHPDFHLNVMSQTQSCKTLKK